MWRDLFVAYFILRWTRLNFRKLDPTRPKPNKKESSRVEFFLPDSGNQHTSSEKRTPEKKKTRKIFASIWGDEVMTFNENIMIKALV